MIILIVFFNILIKWRKEFNKENWGVFIRKYFLGKNQWD